MELKRRKRLSHELHGAGIVGQAFQKLCNGGCDATCLESFICSLAHYPLGRSRVLFGWKEKKRVKQGMTKLKSAARDLEGLDISLFAMRSVVKDWPVPPEDLALVLSRIPHCLNVGMAAPKPAIFRVVSASDRIPYSR